MEKRSSAEQEQQVQVASQDWSGTDNAAASHVAGGENHFLRKYHYVKRKSIGSPDLASQLDLIARLYNLLDLNSDHHGDCSGHEHGAADPLW